MKCTSLTMATAFSLMATSAFAQNVTIFEVQESGGIIVSEGNINLQEAALLLGDSAPPQGATGIVLEKNRPLRWTSLSNREVNEAFEGEGEPATKVKNEPEPNKQDDPDRAPEDPDTTPEDSDSTPADLNDPIKGWGDDTSAKINPTPGYWIGESLGQTVTGCPAGTADALTAQLKVLNGSKLEFTIDETFDPSDVLVDLVWEKIGENSWLGDLESSQAPGGFRVQWAMLIVSETLIKTRQQVAILVLGDACTVLTEVDYGRAN